ncbi:MAG: helix-turn-helix domain-containing protein [Nakamurella sp.]
MTVATARQPVGLLLRQWRERRRISQLELSLQAEISSRHLSFVETGRSQPTPEMIVRLSEQLEVPLRERNQLLLAGGYAPRYPEHSLDAPELGAVYTGLKSILNAHGRNPALIMNRWWELLDSNTAMRQLIADVSPELLRPPVNVLRLSLHPEGLAPRIVNLGQWRAHLLGQLSRRVERTADGKLTALLDELRSYPGDDGGTAAPSDAVLPLRLRVGTADLSFFSIAAAVETAADVAVSELVLEAFYPADAATADALNAGGG